MSPRSGDDFRAVGFWAPKGFVASLMRPRSWTGTAQAPVSMRVVEPRQPEPHGHHLITRWNYNPALHGHRLCIEFKSAEVYRKHHVRWRTFANSLWRVVCKHSSLTFSDIPVDLGDGEVETIPADVFRFARRPGQPTIFCRISISFVHDPGCPSPSGGRRKQTRSTFAALPPARATMSKASGSQHAVPPAESLKRTAGSPDFLKSATPLRSGPGPKASPAVRTRWPK